MKTYLNVDVQKVVGGSMLERENYWVVALWLDNDYSYIFIINLN